MNALKRHIEESGKGTQTLKLFWFLFWSLKFKSFGFEGNLRNKVYRLSPALSSSIHCALISLQLTLTLTHSFSWLLPTNSLTHSAFEGKQKQSATFNLWIIVSFTWFQYLLLLLSNFWFSKQDMVKHLKDLSQIKVKVKLFY